MPIQIYNARLFDTMLAQHLCQPDLPHDLGFVGSIFTQKPFWKDDAAKDLYLYCARDADGTFQIAQQLKPLLKRLKLEDLYKYCQVPLAKICKMMSETGIKIDPNRIKIAREKFIEELSQMEKLLPPELQPYDKSIRVRQLAPEGTLGKSGKPVKYIHIPSTERVVPWQSPKACERYLYETLKLPKQLHPKTKKVTSDRSALERLFRKTQLPALDALRKIRQLDELISTFLRDESDKTLAVERVHSNFLVHGTSTGRLSSSSPNMQNIPPRARYIYVPSHNDWCFVEGDFESLENRLAAWYAGDDERLARLSTPGFNEHRWLASQLYNIPESEITKEMWQYKRGKITNHGADGAMGPRKLSMSFDIPEKESRALLLKWREINHKSADWQERVGNDAVKNGVLTNAFCRKRFLWSQSAYTEGIRFLPQSTGADICFRAMIALCYEQIKWPVELALKATDVLMPLPWPARLVLMVHDSILIETPVALRDEVITCLKTAMTQPWKELAGFSIPVEIKYGDAGASWGELNHRG